MTDFITKVELRGGKLVDYELLDGAMRGFNFADRIRSKHGEFYQLPPGCYFSQAESMTASDVRNMALVAARQAGGDLDIVTVAGDVAFFLHPTDR